MILRLVLVAAFLLLLSGGSHTAQAAVILVSHPQAPVEQFKRAHARSIFSMRARQWDNGAQIRVFVLADEHQLHQRFCQQLLGLLPHQLRRIWNRSLYAGTGVVPVTVATAEEMLERIAATPGSIGYIDGSVGVDSRRDVRVVHVR